MDKRVLHSKSEGLARSKILGISQTSITISQWSLLQLLRTGHQNEAAINNLIGYIMVLVMGI